MSPLVRRFLKTAIGYLLLGLILGVIMLVRRELYHRWPTPWWVSAHTHVILVGFVMMMILGVALWMFPRPVGGDRRFDSRAAEAAYWLLTVGTACRVGGELVHPTAASATVGWVVVLGGAAQAAGLATFFWTMWGRIRGRPEDVPRAS